MKWVLTVTSLLVLWENAEAALTEQPANRLQEYPGKCFSLSAFKVLSVGDVAPLPDCGRVTCSRSGSNLVEIIERCPKLKAQGSCYVAPPDLKYSYPYCCPKSYCPGDDEYMGYVCPAGGTFQTEKWGGNRGP